VITSTWREIFDPSGSNISQDSRCSGRYASRATGVLAEHPLVVRSSAPDNKREE